MSLLMFSFRNINTHLAIRVGFWWLQFHFIYSCSSGGCWHDGNGDKGSCIKKPTRHLIHYSRTGFKSFFLLFFLANMLCALFISINCTITLNSPKIVDDLPFLNAELLFLVNENFETASISTKNSMDFWISLFLLQINSYKPCQSNHMNFFTLSNEEIIK